MCPKASSHQSTNQSTNQVRSLVLPAHEDEATWLKLAGLCRRSKRFALCENLCLRRLNVSPRRPPSFVAGADGNIRLLTPAVASEEETTAATT